MNPLYNTNDSPNNATQPTKAVNRQGVYVPHTHNTFDMSYFHYKTQKFGQYEPFFVMEGVAGDNLPFSNSHNVRALPMSSPFLSSLKLNKDYFMVPNQAIQPNTYEYLFKTPVQGDDVPDDAYNIFPLFFDTDASLLKDIVDKFLLSCDLVVDGLVLSTPNEFIRSLLTLELFLSSGSLLYNLGFKLNPKFINNADGVIYSFDQFFDLIFREYVTYISISIDSDNFVGNFDTDNLSFYEVLSLIRRYGSNCNIVSVSVSETFVAFIDDLTVENLPVYNDKTAYINMDRICAYQLACAQYYVNPQVDFIYNAQLYRDNINSLYQTIWGRNTGQYQQMFFSMNGISVPYDYFSKYYYTQVVHNGIYEQESIIGAVFDYLNALFGYRESLRFGDYFTDSRTRPLAIGDDNVSVSDDGKVSVIDMSKSIIFQRFRNAVVKLGNNFGDFLRGIYGTSPSPDYHFPKFICHQDFDISGFEVANSTSENQGQLVTNLQSGDDTMSFQIEVDMPCIVIGLSYFSLPRVYSQTKDRQFFHKDRFDFFNPMLQYIGDQAVYNDERTDTRPNDEVFGYQSRYNEYKQRYSVASGAFVQSLPAWTFVTDSLFNPVTDIALSNVQSPDFIRAHDYEFNRFFAAMPGLSLATGFHFIVVYNNKCVCARPMEINPSTL